MKKLLYIYMLSLISVFFTQETNAGDPFNVRPWESEPEEDHEKNQGDINTSDHSDIAENNDTPE